MRNEEAKKKDGMHAIVFDAYGLDTICVALDHSIPMLTSPSDIIIRIHAASINPVDWKQAKGSMRDYVRPRLPKVLGMDFSGEIIGLGCKVKEFKLKDMVYGRLATPTVDGTQAEFTKIKYESDFIARKPSWLNHSQAAAIGVAAHTAWECLTGNLEIDFTDYKRNAAKRILIIGCSGGVGIAATQLCKALNVGEIWGVCSTENKHFMETEFKIHVIDYKSGHLSTLLKERTHYFTGILDCVGGIEYYNLAAQTPFILHPLGTFVTIVGKSESGKQGILADLWMLMSAAKKKWTGNIKYGLFLGFMKQNKWKELVQFVGKEKISFFVGREFDMMNQGLEAYKYSESGRARGKVILCNKA